MQGMVYTSNPSEGQSDFSEGCHEGAARVTTRGKVRLSRAWVGSITFFFIDNFAEREGFYIGRGYLPGDSRQIVSYLPGDSRQIVSYLPGDLRLKVSKWESSRVLLMFTIISLVCTYGPFLGQVWILYGLSPLFSWFN